MTRYRCVTARKAEGFSVAAACDAAGVSRSAFYAWANRPAGPTDAELAEAYLLNEIHDIHAAFDGTYGEPRMTAQLRRHGWVVNHKRVERLMRENGIVGHRPRKRRSLTRPDETAPPAPDLVGRLFDPDRTDHTWCGDITYVPTGQAWLYVATVIDLASRRLLGWSMGPAHNATLVTDALKAAVAARGRTSMDGETIFHSDRGTEYTATAFVDACDELGLVRSMGRTGSCLDNAVAESFFATLKVELVNRQHYPTRADARKAIFRWIARYNHRRLHSANQMTPPVEWEARQTEAGLLPSPKAA